MSQLDPTNTTVSDLCTAALQEAQVVGLGQTPLTADLTDTQSRLQWMLQSWAHKRWLVYHLVTLGVTSTGANTYSVGPAGDIDTGAGSMRPDKVESAFLRQLTQSQPNQVDYPLQQLQSFVDFNNIALKQLKSFPQYFFYDPAWPLGILHAYPVAQSAIYGLYLTLKEQLPVSFASLATTFNLPYEYYDAIVLNLAVRLKPKYGMGNDPTLANAAKNALQVLRGGNTTPARLGLPSGLARNGIYNIFSDQSY